MTKSDAQFALFLAHSRYIEATEALTGAALARASRYDLEHLAQQVRDSAKDLIASATMFTDSGFRPSKSDGAIMGDADLASAYFAVHES